MNNISKKSLVIVEGPTGGGKSTYINLAFENHRNILTVESNFQKISRARFTFDEDAHAKAQENDRTKLKKAFEFLSSDSVDTVYIDRLFLSGWVYENIRNYGRVIKSLVTPDSVQLPALLERIHDFVMTEAWENQFTQPFQLELVLICPNTYASLVDRRNKNPDKAYPFASLDWHLYHQIVLAINQYVDRKNTRVSAIYRINDVLLTLIND